MCRKRLGREQDPGKSFFFFFLGLEVPRAFYSLGTLSEVMHLVRPPVVLQGLPPVKPLEWL